MHTVRLYQFNKVSHRTRTPISITYLARIFFFRVLPRGWRSRLERWPRKRKVGVQIPAATDLSRKNLSDSSTAKRSAIGVIARVLEDDDYKRIPGVTVDVAR